MTAEPASDAPPPLVEWLVGRRRPRYRVRSIASVLCGLAWLAFSVAISQQWWNDLKDAWGPVLGTLAIVGVAWLPGYLYAQLLSSVLLDRRERLPDVETLPALTVVVAVYNEEATLRETIERIDASDYPGELAIMIADDGSTDSTLGVARDLAARVRRVRVIACEHGGKHNALNTALGHVSTPLVSSVDADTLLEPGALQRIAARLVGTPGCVAVAGSLLVANDDASLIARLQGWEYRLSIAAIKRQQALFGATLVAQGAFSVYATRQVRDLGGWPDAIGEDILVTWRLIRDGGQVEFEPTAFARTDVPVTARALMRQRRRWARGMVEGLRQFGPDMVGTRRMAAHGVMVNYVFPLIDAAYITVFVPGLIAAIVFENYLVVGPALLAVLPLALTLFALMGRAGRRARTEAGVQIERQWSGFVAYVTFYRALIALASLAGYALELRHARRDW